MSELGAWIDSRRGELVALLQELIRARSENPPGDETRPAAIVSQQLRNLGATVSVFAPLSARPSVVGTFGSHSGPGLLCSAHLDTVPAGDGWSVDPFAGSLRGGAIYGRGAIDHKSPVAALLFAAAALRAKNLLPGHLVFIFDADEETGGALGLSHVLANLDLDVHGVIYAAPTSLSDDGARFFACGRENVFIGSVGVLRVNVSFETTTAYSVAPVDWWFPAEVGTAFAYRLNGAFAHPDWLGGRPRARLREVNANTQVWDVHQLPGESAELVEGTMRTVLKETVDQFERATAALEVILTIPPATTSANCPLVQALIAGAHAATGRRPQVSQLATVTGMSRIQEQLRVPIAAFGYGLIELCHVADERIAVDDLVSASIAYAEAMSRLR